MHGGRQKNFWPLKILNTQISNPMRGDVLHGDKGAPQLQVDENAVASTTAADVAPWWMQVSTGCGQR